MIPGWHFNNLYLLHFSASTTWTTRVFRPITFMSPPTASPQTSPLTEALPRYSTVSAPTNAPLRIPATALTWASSLGMTRTGGWKKTLTTLSPQWSSNATRCVGATSTPATTGLATNSFLSQTAFGKKIFFACRANQCPAAGWTLFSFVPHSSFLYQSWMHVFRADKAPFKGPQSCLMLLANLQRCKDKVRCDSLGIKVPGHIPKQQTQSSIVLL